MKQYLISKSFPLEFRCVFSHYSILFLFVHGHYIGAGGLHKFMNRPNGPLITDSGGFQVFSLAYGSVQESLENEGELKRININRNNRDPNGNKSSPVKVTEVSLVMGDNIINDSSTFPNMFIIISFFHS